jgi:hypothetical protein
MRTDADVLGMHIFGRDENIPPLVLQFTRRSKICFRRGKRRILITADKKKQREFCHAREVPQRLVIRDAARMSTIRWRVFRMAYSARGKFPMMDWRWLKCLPKDRTGEGCVFEFLPPDLHG